MDKSRELRRGVSRFSPAKRQLKQSGHKLLSVLNGGENVDSPERSKKEKVRGFNNVSRGGSSSNEGSEMIGVSEGEEELRQPRQLQPPSTTGGTKRTKFPRKSFDECNGVDPASVPRKLRSAMNKRTHESISPPSPVGKKLQSTLDVSRIETPQLNGVKKVKQGMRQVNDLDGSLKQPIPGSITKDEEEVVETLYAMARMVSDNPVKHEVDVKTSETKLSSPLPKAKESSLPASEAPAEEHKKLWPPSNTAEPNKTESFTGDPIVSNLTEFTTPEQPSITGSQKFCIGSNGSPIHADLQGVPLLSRGEMPFCTVERLRDPSELCPDTGLVQPKHDNHLPRKKTENLFWPVTDVEVEQDWHPINETKDNVTSLTCTKGSPALWPGLCTAGLCVGGLNHSSERPPSATAPAWLDTATSSIRPSSAENIVSTEKVSPIFERNQSWKRCVTHVHICHLIQASRKTHEIDRWSIPSDQLKSNEGMQADLVASSNPTRRDNLNGINSVSSVGVSPNKKSLNDQRLGIALEKRIQQDQKQAAATTSGMYAQQNQSCNFLSLSSGDGGLEASCTDNGNNKSGSIIAGNGLEKSTQLHFPYFNSLAQHRPLLPFSMPHSPYLSSPYLDQLTAAATGQQVQVQVPQYLGGPFFGPAHLGHAGLLKQQQHQQSAHAWAAQMATHYRSTGILGSHLPKWHNGGPDTTNPFIPCAQAIHPTSTPNAACSTGQQQQNLFAMSSSSSSHRGMKQQHHRLPNGYNEIDGGFHSEGSSRKQLLAERV